jgi:hypothetical protein
MMCLNPSINFVPFIPEDIPLSVVQLTYGLFHEERNDEILDCLNKKIQETPDDYIFSQDELEIYQHHCELFIAKARQQINNSPETCQFTYGIPSWKCLEFLWKWYNAYPPSYDLHICFAEILEYQDMTGLQFLLETIIWQPEDIGNFFDEIFRNEEIARYIITELDIDDWIDVFEEMYGRL